MTIQGRARVSRSQWVLVLVISTLVFAFTAILQLRDGGLFQRIFGQVSPWLVVSLSVVSGAVTLAVLRSRGWFEIWRPATGVRGLAHAATIATVFAGIAVVLDCSVNFPEDTNVLLPESLLFYPVAAFVVEALFHLLPLTLVLLGARRLLPKANPNTVVWACLVAVSLLEPIFQLVASTWDAPWWANAYLGFHIFAINLLQLYIFKRYDFASMYAFRIVYYLLWHILWGQIRLQVLF